MVGIENVCLIKELIKGKKWCIPLCVFAIIHIVKSGPGKIYESIFNSRINDVRIDTLKVLKMEEICN